MAGHNPQSAMRMDLAKTGFIAQTIWQARRRAA